MRKHHTRGRALRRCARSASGSTSCSRRWPLAAPGPRPPPLSPARPAGADARGGERESGRRPRSTTGASANRTLGFARPWSTPTSPNSQQSWPPPARCCCSRGAGGCRCSRGLGLLGAGEGLLAISISGTGKLDTLTSPSGAAAAVAAGVVLAALAAVAVRRPAWVPVAVLVAAPLRPPIAFESGGGFPIAVADDGQLGRLLPLYFVLAAAALALAWRVLAQRVRRGAGAAARGRVARRGVHRLRMPVAHVGRPDRARGGAAHLLHDPVRPAAWPWSRGRPSPTGRRACWRRSAIGLGAGVRGGGALPGRHARAVLLRPEPGGLEQQLRLLPGDLAVRRPEPLRPPRGARHGDPAGGAGAAPDRHAPRHRRCWR